MKTFAKGFCEFSAIAIAEEINQYAKENKCEIAAVSITKDGDGYTAIATFRKEKGNGKE